MDFFGKITHMNNLAQLFMYKRRYFCVFFVRLALKNTTPTHTTGDRPGLTELARCQDSSEHGSDRVGELQFWMALVEVTPDMGPMRFINRTHMEGPLGSVFNQDGDDLAGGVAGYRASGNILEQVSAASLLSRPIATYTLLSCHSTRCCQRCWACPRPRRHIIRLAIARCTTGTARTAASTTPRTATASRTCGRTRQPTPATMTVGRGTKAASGCARKTSANSR